jgi:hypothetical protein
MDVNNSIPTRCPIKGHNHDLVLHGPQIVQEGTGRLAQWLACPNGNYRWFWIVDYSTGLEGTWRSVYTKVITDEEPYLPLAPRYPKPHWGWKD